jgi:hypothetical protein
MPGPTQLNITVVTNAGGATGGTLTGATFTVPIPAALQALDSGNSSGQGQVSQLNTSTGIWSTGQTGFSSVDEAIRAIYRAGTFFVPSTSTWYSASTIQSITWT